MEPSMQGDESTIPQCDDDDDDARQNGHGSSL